MMAAIRFDLIQHVGGSPSVTQRLLIERCVQLSLHLALLDRKLATGEILGEGASRQYLAWSNSLSRALRELGLQPAATPKRRRLADHLAGRSEGQPG